MAAVLMSQVAATKQREAEALVADFTSVVQQQKAAIHALQREKETMAARLKVRGLGGCTRVWSQI